MAEYIEREILLKKNFYTENCNSEENRWNDYAIKDIIMHIPAADVAPVKHGHWIFGATNGHSWQKCSECCVLQQGQTLCFSYCPNCGSRMVGETI